MHLCDGKLRVWGLSDRGYCQKSGAADCAFCRIVYGGIYIESAFYVRERFFIYGGHLAGQKNPGRKAFHLIERAKSGLAWKRAGAFFKGQELRILGL